MGKLLEILIVIVMVGSAFGKPTIITDENNKNILLEEIIIEEVEEIGVTTELIGWMKMFHHYANHSSHCHFRNKPEIHLAPGKSTTVAGECMLITCIDPDINSISASWCPSIFPSQNCKIKKGDRSKSYPECCPALSCT